MLSALPDHVRDALVIGLGKLKDLPANRHPLQKAFRELGMGSRILEVDIRRGQEHQMLVCSHSALGAQRPRKMVKSGDGMTFPLKNEKWCIRTTS